MIAYIDGKLVQKDPTFVVLEAGGIGYFIKISLQTFSQIKAEDKFKLHTYLHIKEDSHTLYGFSEGGEKKIFMELIGISGIGPGTAMIMLSSLSASEIENAILTEDVKTIQRVKGIGSKTAQRVILELKDKIKKSSSTTEISSVQSFSNNNIRSEALQALVTLGIPKAAADKNLDAVVKKEGNNLSLEQLIKSALKMN